MSDAALREKPARVMTTLGNPGWIAHSGPDGQAAQAFYRDILGWKIGDLPMQDGSSYAGILLGEEPIGGFSPMPEESGAWTIYITVADVDAAVAKAEGAGATVLAGPMDMAGVGRMAQLLDPQGARFAVITYESMQG